MKDILYNPLQLREIFHLEFLRHLGKRAKLGSYVLKGGANLRFFFNSFRYSEDMDLDIRGGEIGVLKDAIMKILNSQSFQDVLNPFGIEKVVPPNISRAKQTETTQRFKVHLMTYAGEDLFTKIEFSRRGFKGDILVQSVSDTILRAYKLPPLLLPHYDILSTILQKIETLADRAVIQARDIFDLYILSSQYEPNKRQKIKINAGKLTKSYENIFEISFEKFRDTVISYLSLEDQRNYNSSSLWDGIQLKTANFINEFKR